MTSRCRTSSGHYTKGNEPYIVAEVPQYNSYNVCRGVPTVVHRLHVNPLASLKYHVRIVGGAIGKALLLFPEARSPSHLVEELLASRVSRC